MRADEQSEINDAVSGVDDGFGFHESPISRKKVKIVWASRIFLCQRSRGLFKPANTGVGYLNLNFLLIKRDLNTIDIFTNLNSIFGRILSKTAIDITAKAKERRLFFPIVLSQPGAKL